MTLNQLEYFCAVCRYHSITRAAAELFVTQPTFSVAIRDLEKEFNIKLFNHGKNKITLTSEGEEFYKKASGLLVHSHELYDEFGSMGRNIPAIRIGIPPLMSTVFFPRLINLFQKNYNIPIKLYEYGSIRASNLINEDILDVALVNMDFYNISKFESYFLMNDSYVFCVSKNHRFSNEKEITLDMLKDEPIILFNTDSVQNSTIFARYHAMNIIPEVLLHSSQLGTILNFVRGGNCGAFLYSSLAVNPRDFVEIPVKPEITSDFGLLWKKGKIPNSKTTKFIDFIRSNEYKDIFTCDK